MNWLRDHRRSAWICGLTLSLPLIAFCYALTQTAAAGADYRREAAGLEPRIARLAGLVDNQELIRASAQSADLGAGKLIFPATVDPVTAGTGLQKDLREIFAEAGLSVSNSQVLPVREEGDFDYIGLRLTVTGELGDLDIALSAVGEYEPRLFVTTIEVGPARARRGAQDTQEITASLQLFALRALL